MNRIAMALAALAMAFASSPLLADMFKCVDQAGHVTYSNVGGKACKRLIADSEPTAPATRGYAKQASPPDFPKIGDTVQKARDDDRRRILEAEMKAEESALENSRKALAEQEAIRTGDERNYQRVLDRLQPFKNAVALHERNIEALKKELANAR